VLSGIEPADFVRAVQTSDVARLTRIPGVGRKTAERMTLELRGRLPPIDAATPADVPAGTDALRNDVVSALVNLGYQSALVDKAVTAALNGAGEAPAFEAVLKSALRQLAR
jgi:holliday junction DNA helicase RuvA